MKSEDQETLLAQCLQPAYCERNLALRVADSSPPDTPYVLLLGAGASASSGVPTARTMVDRWRATLHRQLIDANAVSPTSGFDGWRATDYPAWLRERIRPGESEYSILFSHFHSDRASRQIHIESTVRDSFPTWGYLYFAGLVHAGRFRNILTTNFDDLAADSLFRFYDMKPAVLSFDAALASIRFDSPRPKVLKLHGDFLYDNLRNVRDELKNLDREMEERLFRCCAETGLIVVGYAGADQSVMGPLRELLRKRYLPLGLHWCARRALGERPTVPVGVLELLRDFPEQVHVYSIASFDTLMESIFVECRCSPPPVLAKPSTSSILPRFSAACRDHMAAVPTDAMVRFEEDFVAAARSPGDTLSLWLVLCEGAWARATNAQKRGDWPAAVAEATRAYEMLEETLPRALASEIPLEFRIRSLNRGIGVYLTLAELAVQTNDHAGCDLEAHSSRALELVEKVLPLLETEEGRTLPARHRHVPYYNACCVTGVRRQAGYLPTEEELSRLRRWIAALEAMDPDRQYWGDLGGELGFQALRDLIPERDR